jgi:hypothetical protein
MPKLSSLGDGECIAELGLSQALKYVEEQRRLCGEDLGIVYVEAWCHNQWRWFQRRCRIEHLFGKRQYCQFPAWQYGLWSEAERESDFEFDLVVGKYESGAENLDFVFWTYLQQVSEESRRHFEILDPNWPRFGNDVIIQMAKEVLPSPQSPPQAISRQSSRLGPEDEGCEFAD